MLAGGGHDDPALAAELEQLGQHVVRFNERVRSFVRRVDEELARSSMLLSSAADQTKVSASRRKIADASATPSSSPAIAGPTKNVKLSIVLPTAFAAVSS